MTKQAQIDALEKAIKSSVTPENLKEKMRVTLNKLKNSKTNETTPLFSVLEYLYDADSKGMNAVKVNSRGEIAESDSLTKKYAIAVNNAVKKAKIKPGSLSKEVFEELSDDNFHFMNEFLVWNGYYDKETTDKNKSSYERIWKKGNRQVANPEFIIIGKEIKSTSATPLKKAAKKYYANREIKSITVIENGKKVTYFGKDVFNGANFLEKGGKLSERAKYVTKANIVSVEFLDGTKDKPSNGYHIKNGATPILEDGGTIGFIPMQLEEQLYHISKFNNRGIKEVIEVLSAMIDAGLTKEDLNYSDSKTSISKREKNKENKIKEIWSKSEPFYKGELNGNHYYSIIGEIVRKPYILDEFRPYRKYQKFEKGGKIPNNYNGKTAQEVWNEWDLKQREHFLADHYDVIQTDLASMDKNYEDLAFETQSQLALHIEQGQYEHGGPVYLPEGSLIHYQNYYLEKGGKVNSSEVIKLIPLELESLSSQLKKYTGEQYSSDFVDVNGKDNLPQPGEILVHKISGMKFLMPEKIYNHIDGYNLVIDKSNSEIVVFENGKTIAEIVDGKLDFTFKDSDISINKPKVLAAFDKNKIPFLVIKPEYEVFDLSGFLNYVYPKAKELLKEYNLKLDKDFTISKGKQSFLAEPMYSSIDGKAGKVVIAYYDDEMEMVGTIDFNLSDNELHFQFEDWKIDEVDMYKLGGSLKSAWKRERKYVNKSQDYETRYAKGKNRSGYKDKFEKGGFIDWKSKPDKKVKGIYEISSPNFKGNVEIVGFEREDDVFYSLYQPLSGERIGPKEIHTFKVNSNKINNLDKGNVVIALNQLGNKIKVKRVANLGTQNYLQKGGKINKNSKVGKYAKVDIGGYGNIFHYGKIMSFDENGAFEDYNGYKVSGIGDLLKEGQFSVITEKEYLDKRKNIPSNDSELKKDSFVLIIKDLKPKQKKEGNPIFKKASEIREPGEKWLDAVKRAKSLV